MSKMENGKTAEAVLGTMTGFAAVDDQAGLPAPSSPPWLKNGDVAARLQAMTAALAPPPKPTA
jgi:hypothetical protein